MGWWLNLTAPPVPKYVMSIDEQERLRKAELTSFCILAVFLFLIALVVNTLANAATAQAVLIMAVGLVIAAVCNRFGVGHMRFAAWWVPALLFAMITLAIVGNKSGLDLVLLPAYDLYVIPIFISSLTVNDRIPWLFGGLAVGVILLTFFTEQHALYTIHSAAAGQAEGFDGVGFLLSRVGPIGAVNRHVAEVVFAALFGWLGARSVDRAIKRADRAELIAEMERRELESKAQIEFAARHLLDVHTRVASGDFNSRAALDRGNVLWSVGQSLNNLLQRLQRQGQSEYQLRRTEEEAQRLASALDEANSGRMVVQPPRANTVIDLLIDRFVFRIQQAGRGGYPGAQTQPQAQPPVQPPAQPYQQQSPAFPPQWQAQPQPQPQPQAQPQQAVPPQRQQHLRPQAPVPSVTPPAFTPTGHSAQRDIPPGSRPVSQAQVSTTGNLPDLPVEWPSLPWPPPPPGHSNQPYTRGGDPQGDAPDGPWYGPPRPEGTTW